MRGLLFLFVYEQLAVCSKQPALILRHFRVLRVDFFKRLQHRFRHQVTRIPLVVGGDDVPWAVFCCGRVDGVLIGLRVFIPELALFNVRGGKLPVFNF